MDSVYEQYLRGLLAPLGVYDLAGGAVGGGELAALGAGLDGVSALLDLAEREALTASAATLRQVVDGLEL